MAGLRVGLAGLRNGLLGAGCVPEGVPGQTLLGVVGRVDVLLVRHEALLFASLATGDRELRESVCYLCVVCVLPVGRSQVCKRQLIVPVLGYDPGPTNPGGELPAPRQMGVEHAPELSAGTQHPGRLVEHPQGGFRLLGVPPVEWGIGGDHVEAVVGETGQAVGPADIDVETVGTVQIGRASCRGKV